MKRTRKEAYELKEVLFRELETIGFGGWWSHEYSYNLELSCEWLGYLKELDLEIMKRIVDLVEKKDVSINMNACMDNLGEPVAILEIKIEMR